ncbi:AMP-binding protein [Puniceibacterium sediminis]|uniref:Amino acid adenylation domain-containing protein n=1 Tax=Puniceibacterium sediminis TaxID=1608407 RepID=A0A238ZA17_9RHOB|nr:AMP-binding protein [Puniceibacterium sediminis]SNR80167.1 amino acid adenylation domain-containing protein [Puniceibacterium sediminis]
MSTKLQSLHLMTGLQESLFAFEAESGPDESYSAYIEQFSCKLNGEADVATLAQAWQDLTDRHTSLRTAFVRTREGKAVQAVLTHRAPDVRCLDVDAGASFSAMARAERGRRFDLARDPLLRVVLIPKPDGSCAMIVTFHHIILDAWSAPTLIGDLMALYAHRLGRGAEPTAPARATVGAFADSQKSRRGAAGKAFWASALKGAGSAALPVLDVTQPPGPKSTVIRPLPDLLGAEMQSFSSSLSITPSAVLHALWGCVLARLTDRDDAVFASVMANRSHDLPDIDRAVGLFAATLPVTVDLSHGKGFADLCREMQVQLRDAPLWSAMPLADILAAGGLRADLLDHTMIGRPAALAWGQADSLDFPEAGLTVCDYSAESADHYDFQIGFSLGEGPYLEVRHDVNRVPVDRVEMLLSLALDLLGRLLARPSVPILSVPICATDVEASRIFGKVVAAPVPSVTDAIALGDPTSQAVGDTSETLDRAALMGRAAQTAAALAEQGVKAGDRVAIAAVQSNTFLVQVLACWRLGAAFVPINPAWPALRQQQILDAARPRLALGLPARRSPHEPAIDTPDTGLAYCIFTSGSTGAPKGVAVPHDALANYCQAVGDSFGFTAQDRALQVTSPAFDLGYTTAFGLLASGGAVFWLGAEAAVDPDLVLRAMAVHQITVMKATPAFLHLLLSAPDPGRFAALTQWRLLILGGESPVPEQIARLAALCPWLRLACHYGPTEATIGCAMTEPRPIAQWAERDAHDLGTPVAGAEIRIVDRKGDTLPRGIRGEIAVGGGALSRGYLDPAPQGGFSRIDGERFYLTGDLGVVTADGSLRFSGRRDGISKIRGHRVDPEETRLALLRDTSIEAAAVAIRGEGVAAQLVAFVKMRDGLRDPARLRDALAQHLPSVQIPQRFFFLSRLLMTENGKTDTAAMLAALGELPDGAPKGMPPETATEKRLARIWAEVLGLETVAANDDFFLLGGHSLRAIEVSAVMERETGQRLPLRWFTDRPMLRDMCARIDAVEGNGVAEPVAAIMRLWDRGDTPRVLCFPGLMGSSGIYREWLTKLAPEYSVAGIDDLPELDAAPDVPSTVRWILEQAPDVGRGYQVLLGWSFGADLAIEAAAQLGLLGVSPLVILLDRLPGEQPLVQDVSQSPLESRRYWSQVMRVLRGALPETRVAEYEAQFAQRIAKQRAYVPAAPLANPIVGVLAAPEGPVPQARLDRLSALSRGTISVLTCGADHFSLFHPPHVTQWTEALRSLIAAHLAGNKLPETCQPAGLPLSGRRISGPKTLLNKEVEV